MKKNISFLIIILLIGIITGTYIFIRNQANKLPPANSGINMENLPTSDPGTNNTKPKSNTMKTYSTKPEMSIDKNKTYEAVFKTSQGEFTVLLSAKETPITVNNFVFLAKEGFYDGVIFHRIVKDFMIQGGDPTGTGTGGPGYSFDDESFSGEYTRGTLAMANSGPDTNGSQFFIMHKDVPLSKDYVIFGKVIKGIEIIDKIANLPTKVNPGMGENSSPINPPVINSIEITEK
jgi:peptidylprolyl isomerase